MELSLWRCCNCCVFSFVSDFSKFLEKNERCKVFELWFLKKKLLKKTWKNNEIFPNLPTLSGPQAQVFFGYYFLQGNFPSLQISQGMWREVWILKPACLGSNPNSATYYVTVREQLDLSELLFLLVENASVPLIGSLWASDDKPLWRDAMTRTSARSVTCQCYTVEVPPSRITLGLANLSVVHLGLSSWFADPRLHFPFPNGHPSFQKRFLKARTSEAVCVSVVALCSLWTVPSFPASRALSQSATTVLSSWVSRPTRSPHAEDPRKPLLHAPLRAPQCLKERPVHRRDSMNVSWKKKRVKEWTLHRNSSTRHQDNKWWFLWPVRRLSANKRVLPGGGTWDVFALPPPRVLACDKSVKESRDYHHYLFFPLH